MSKLPEESYYQIEDLIKSEQDIIQIQNILHNYCTHPFVNVKINKDTNEEVKTCLICGKTVDNDDSFNFYNNCENVAMIKATYYDKIIYNICEASYEDFNEEAILAETLQLYSDIFN